MEVLDHPILTPIGKQAKNNPRVQPVPFIVKMLRLYFQLLGRLLPGPTASVALRIFSKPRTRHSTKAFDGLLTKSQIFTVHSNGLEIHGRVWDNPGPTVLLVHGWETSGLHLGSFIEPLWSEGYKVVIFDGPAHGDSQGSHTTLPGFAEAMRAVIRKTGPVDHLIAHSFGGFASIYLAANFVEEVSFEKMVLISTPNKLTKIISDFAIYLKIPDQVKWEMYKLIKLLYNFDPEEIESAVMGQRMVVDEILVIHDRYDGTLPFYHSLEIANFISKSILLETENLGHNRILKHPEVISRIRKFLRS